MIFSKCEKHKSYVLFGTQVLDHGCIQQFDTPENLLNDTDGIFYHMAKDIHLRHNMMNNGQTKANGMVNGSAPNGNIVLSDLENGHLNLAFDGSDDEV